MPDHIARFRLYAVIVAFHGWHGTETYGLIMQRQGKPGPPTLAV